MNYIWEGLREAGRLIFTLDPDVLDSAWRSVWISSAAVGLAMLLGIPLGLALARKAFLGRRAVIVFSRAAMAVPTVFVGVVCYAIFNRSGPLGPLEILMTPWAIVVGELLLALPIIISLTHNAVASLDVRVGETAWTLGAGRLRRCATYISEARSGVALATLTAFARCVTELGVAMIVGGNLPGRTQTLATAAAQENSKGEFARGLAMGILLLCISLGVTCLIARLGRERPTSG
ncbi:MAG: ABC transporter permease [Pirellulales bacterium]|nr:ABC transporter permease [Pirellulales bacterium]